MNPETEEDKAVSALIEKYEREKDDSEMLDGLWTSPLRNEYLKAMAEIGGDRAKEYVFNLVKKGADWLKIAHPLQILSREYPQEVEEFMFQQITDIKRDSGEVCSAAAYNLIDCINNSHNCYAAIDSRLTNVARDSATPRCLRDLLNTHLWELCHNQPSRRTENAGAKP